jgi:hypothetical protein
MNKLISFFIIISLIYILYKTFKYEHYDELNNTYFNDTYHKINNLKIDNNNYLFHDIFARNNELILINNNLDLNYDNLIINYNNNNLKIKSKIIKKDNTKRNHIFIIIIYEIIINKTIDININIKYNDNNYNYNLLHLLIPNKQYQLIQTTLFKNDAYLLNMFTTYYLYQGIEHFYIYYNDDINNLNLNNILNLDYITFIEWNYNYNNQAQITSMNHSLYKYAKINSNYILYNDLDEYTYIPNNILSNIIHSNADTYVFLNVWADIIDIPNDIESYYNNLYNITKIPNKILKHNDIFKYKERSKCLHKSDNIKTVTVHYAYEYNINDPIIFINDNNIILHFFRWSSKKSRTRDKIMSNKYSIFDIKY